MSSQLTPEDQQRVDQYLSAPQHQVSRRPFNTWLLLAVVIGSVVLLGLLSRALARLVY